MADEQAKTLGTAKVDIRAKLDKLDADLSQAKQKVSGLGSDAEKAGSRMTSAFNAASGPVRSLGTGLQGMLTHIVSVAGGIALFEGAVRVAETAMRALKAATVDAFNAAAEEEIGVNRLGASVTAAGGDWEKYGEIIEAQITHTQKLAFADDELRDSYSRLIQMGNSWEESVGLQNDAMDLARGTGMDLAMATQLVGKVDAGNIAMLARYGIILDENATKEQALAEIRRRYAGQAEAYARTATGAAQRFSTVLGNIQETFGGAFLKPLANVFTKLSELGEKAMPYIQAFADMVGEQAAKAGDWIVEKLDGALNTIDQWGPELVDRGLTLMTQLAEGIVNGASAVITAVAGVISLIADFFPASPAKRGELRNAPKWGQELFAQISKGFSNADFSMVDKGVDMMADAIRDRLTKQGQAKGLEGDALKKFITSGLKEQLPSAVSLGIAATDEMKRTGDISEETWSRLGDVLGDAREDYAFLLAAEHDYQDAIAGDENIKRLEAGIRFPQSEWAKLIPDEVAQMSAEGKEDWIEGQRKAWEEQKKAAKDEYDGKLKVFDLIQKINKEMEAGATGAAGAGGGKGKGGINPLGAIEITPEAQKALDEAKAKMQGLFDGVGEKWQEQLFGKKKLSTEVDRFGEPIDIGREGGALGKMQTAFADMVKSTETIGTNLATIGKQFEEWDKKLKGPRDFLNMWLTVTGQKTPTAEEAASEVSGTGITTLAPDDPRRANVKTMAQLGEDATNNFLKLFTSNFDWERMLLPGLMQSKIEESYEKPFVDAQEKLVGHSIIPDTIDAIEDSFRGLTAWLGEQVDPFTAAGVALGKGLGNGVLGQVNLMGIGVSAAFNSMITATVESINALIGSYNATAAGKASPVTAFAVPELGAYAPVPAFASGGYTGNYQGLAYLHPRELILNEQQQRAIAGPTINVGGITIQANSAREGRAGMRGALDELARRTRTRTLMGPPGVLANGIGG